MSWQIVSCIQGSGLWLQSPGGSSPNVLSCDWLCWDKAFAFRTKLESFSGCLGLWDRAPRENLSPELVNEIGWRVRTWLVHRWTVSYLWMCHWSADERASAWLGLPWESTNHNHPGAKMFLGGFRWLLFRPHSFVPAVKLRPWECLWDCHRYLTLAKYLVTLQHFCSNPY